MGPAALLLAAVLAADGPEVRFEVRDVGGAGAKALPVTLSALFRPGAFREGEVTAVVRAGPDGAPAVVPAQVDVLSHHDDGSLQHALVTLPMDLAPRATQEVFLVPSPQAAPAGGFAPDAPDAPVLVELVDRGGAHWTAELAQPAPDDREGPDLRAGPLFGPLAREIERRAPLRGADGSPLSVEVRARWRRLAGIAGVRVEIAVENCAPPGAAPPPPGDLEFQELAIDAGERALADLKGGVLFDRTRLVVRGFVGAEPTRLMIREDPVELARAAFVPPYDFTRPLSDAQAAERVRRLIGSDTTGTLDPGRFALGVPLDSGPIAKYMPATGDRGDIGPLPVWAVLALNSRSVAAEDALLAADFCGAGSFPIHVRAADGTMGIGFAAAAALEKREHRIKCPRTPDRAHAPLLGYPSFLLTGDVFAQEEFAAEAAFCFYDWPHDGRYRYPGTRDFAWSLRTTMLAAKLLPDANPLRAYLRERLAANLRELQRVRDSDAPLHLWGVFGWEASGRKSWPCATQASPWQVAWVAGSLDWTARLFGGPRGAPAPAAPAVATVAADARALGDWASEYFTRAYASVGQTFRAPDGTTVTWTSGHYALAYSFPATTYQAQVVAGQWGVKEGSVRPIGSYAEALWYLRVNGDHAFDPGKAPPLPAGPDGVATRPATEWRPNGSWSPPPPPSPGWISYSLNWLAALLEAEGTPEGHAVWAAARPAIESQVALPGLRFSPALWTR